MIYGKYNNGSSDIVFAYYGEVLTIVTYQDWEMSVKVRKLWSDNHAVLFPADVGTLSAGNTDIWQEISINLYILMRICNKHYSFRSIVSLTAGLMCFIHFKMSINVQVMPQMYILLTGNLPCLSRVRRKQQIKERPADKQWVIHLCLMASVVSSFRFWQNHKLIWYKTKVNSLFVISFFAWTL